MQRNTICIAKLTNSDVYNLFVAQGFQLFGITYVVFHSVTKPVVITFPPKIKIVIFIGTLTFQFQNTPPPPPEN